MIKRLPLILFILTLVSCAFMVLIRIGGAGTKLLTAKTGTGRFIAANYNSCIVVFVIILAAFIIVTVVLNRKRRKRKEKHAAAAAAHTDEPIYSEAIRPEETAYSEAIQPEEAVYSEAVRPGGINIQPEPDDQIQAADRSDQFIKS